MSTSVTGSITSQFSAETLALQNNYCCDNANERQIKWVTCKPAIYKGSKTIFSSDDLGLCSWYQTVTSNTFNTVTLNVGEEQSFEINAEYIFLKVWWPTGAITESKNVEIGLNGQGGVVGSMIPFYIESPDPIQYQYFLVRDVFSINTSSLVSHIIIRNVSPYDEVTICVMGAK